MSEWEFQVVTTYVLRNQKKETYVRQNATEWVPITNRKAIELILRRKFTKISPPTTENSDSK